MVSESLTTLATRLGGSKMSNATGIPKRYRKYSVCDFPLPLVHAALNFLERGDASLLLTGKLGTGKTAFASAILVAWRWCHPSHVEPWRNGIFLPVYEAAEILRDMETAVETRQEWQETPLLVLDDVGANRSTPHLMEQLLFLQQIDLIKY